MPGKKPRVPPNYRPAPSCAMCVNENHNECKEYDYHVYADCICDNYTLDEKKAEFAVMFSRVGENDKITDEE